MFSFNFLTKNSLFVSASNQGGSGLDKRVLYDGRRPPSGGGGTVCTQAKALGIAAIVLAALLTAALVIAYAGPQAGRHPFQSLPSVSY